VFTEVYQVSGVLHAAEDSQPPTLDTGAGKPLHSGSHSLYKCLRNLHRKPLLKWFLPLFAGPCGPPAPRHVEAAAVAGHVEED